MPVRTKPCAQCGKPMIAGGIQSLCSKCREKRSIGRKRKNAAVPWNVREFNSESEMKEVRRSLKRQGYTTFLYRGHPFRLLWRKKKR